MLVVFRDIFPDQTHVDLDSAARTLVADDWRLPDREQLVRPDAIVCLRLLDVDLGAILYNFYVATDATN